MIRPGSGYARSSRRTSWQLSGTMPQATVIIDFFDQVISWSMPSSLREVVCFACKTSFQNRVSHRVVEPKQATCSDTLSGIVIQETPFNSLSTNRDEFAQSVLSRRQSPFSEKLRSKWFKLVDNFTVTVLSVLCSVLTRKIKKILVGQL